MQFSSLLVAAATLALANAAAQFTMTPAAFVGVKTGTPFLLTWSNSTGPVTLLLKNGVSTNLQTVETIASGVTGTSYSWTPESTLVSGTYAFEIDDGGVPNYSVQFALSGAASSSSSASSTSSGSSSTSTGSSTSSGSTTTSSSTSTTTSASNSTTTTGSSSKTTSATKTGSSTGSSTSSTTSPSSLSGASSVASPLAFVLLAIAAIMTLN